MIILILKILKIQKRYLLKKEFFFPIILKKNSIYAVGTASVEEIEKINILNASLLSMQRALEKLNHKPSIAYIDGLFSPKNINIKCKTIIRGDEKIISIAAASIVAKSTRDLFMIRLAKKFPKYSWDKNFGYGTSAHLEGLKKFGITKHHRKKFKPVHNILMNIKRETL